jgi:hypothetical protein
MIHRRLSDKQHDHLVALRKQGKSIPEIARETGTPITTVQRHIKGTHVPKEYQTLLREKQGGSKERARDLRSNIMADTKKLLGEISRRDYLFLLIGLYWGEGTKRDFCVINSDPLLIQAFIYCLKTLNIPNDRLSITLRVHTEISIPQAKIFWSQITGVSKQIIQRVEIIEGKKKGKLPHGMCRIRVRSGIRDRLLIQSAIALIGKECNKRILSQ